MPPAQQKTINQVVAENLAHWISERGMKQTALAAKAGVSQKTISNYLNPKQRAEGATGKEPSAKLSELARIADALGVEVWQLTRPAADELDRVMYEAIEQAMVKLRSSVPAAVNVDAQEALERSRTTTPEEQPAKGRKRA